VRDNAEGGTVSDISTFDPSAIGTVGNWDGISVDRTTMPLKMRTWHAREACELLGGRVVIPDSPEKNERLHNFTKPTLDYLQALEDAGANLYPTEGSNNNDNFVGVYLGTTALAPQLGATIGPDRGAWMWSTGVTFENATRETWRQGSDSTEDTYLFWANWPASCALFSSEEDQESCRRFQNSCHDLEPHRVDACRSGIHPMSSYSNWAPGEPDRYATRYGGSWGHDSAVMKADGMWHTIQRSGPSECNSCGFAYVVCEAVCSPPPTPPPPAPPPCEVVVLTFYNPCKCDWDKFHAFMSETLGLCNGGVSWGGWCWNADQPDQPASLNGPYSDYTLDNGPNNKCVYGQGMDTLEEAVAAITPPAYTGTRCNGVTRWTNGKYYGRKSTTLKASSATNNHYITWLLDSSNPVENPNQLTDGRPPPSEYSVNETTGRLQLSAGALALWTAMPTGPWTLHVRMRRVGGGDLSAGVAVFRADGDTPYADAYNQLLPFSFGIHVTGGDEQAGFQATGWGSNFMLASGGASQLAGVDSAQSAVDVDDWIWTRMVSEDGVFSMAWHPDGSSPHPPPFLSAGWVVKDGVSFHSEYAPDRIALVRQTQGNAATVEFANFTLSAATEVDGTTHTFDAQAAAGSKFTTKQFCLYEGCHHFEISDGAPADMSWLLSRRSDEKPLVWDEGPYQDLFCYGTPHPPPVMPPSPPTPHSSRKVRYALRYAMGPDWCTRSFLSASTMRIVSASRRPA
jgi:hypothetical protein